MSELPVDAEQSGRTGELDSLGVGEFWGDCCAIDLRLVRLEVSIAATEYDRTVLVEDPSVLIKTAITLSYLAGKKKSQTIAINKKVYPE
jgi:hypothetical protein